MKFFRNDQGIALPVTLLAMLVFSLLGTALWHSSVASTAQTSRRQENMQAHYIARSGAEALASHLINHLNPAAEADRLVATTATNPATASIGNGNFRARLVRPSAGLLKIVSIGQSGAASAQTTLYLSRKRSLLDVFRGAITQTSTTPLDLKIATVTGAVYSGGIIINRRNHTGSVYHTAQALPPVSLPNLPSGGAIQGPATIAHGLHYTRIASGTGQNKDLTFQTVAGNTVQVVVDTLEAKKDIILQGEGRLELFITGHAEIKTGKPRNINRIRNESNLIVYLMPGATIQFQANPTFHGYIYAPQARVYLQSGQTTVRGSIVAQNIFRMPNNHNGPNGVINHVPVPPGITIPLHAFEYQRSHWSN